jgi:TonB family protein
MFNLRVVGQWVFCLSWLAASSHAQSVSIDESKPTVEAPVPIQPKPTIRPQLDRVVPPVAVSTPVEYPEAAQGAQEVVLALTIAKDGSVTAATAISGAQPFAAHAENAARNWRFSPATRSEQPVAAKIRYLVKFVPPSDIPEPEKSPGQVRPHETPKTKREAKVPDTADYEVVVSGSREPLRHQLGSAEIRDMLGAFGDPFRAIEALPGVVPMASGLPYFYVRGAPPGNVGYFFDGIPVPYLYHFAAGPGVLNPAFVDHVDLYPGAYPSRYGRFAGAVVSGEMANPSDRLRGEGSIRLVDSGAMLEVPFASGRGSLMMAGRYSYTGLVVSLIQPKIKLSYWDYQTRVRYKLDSHNTVEIVAFGSADFLSARETDQVAQLGADNMTVDWVTREQTKTLVDAGFHRLDLRWDRAIPRGRWRNALTFGYDRTFFDNEYVLVSNRLEGFRSEFEQRTEDGMLVRAGADVLYESRSQVLDLTSPGIGAVNSLLPSSARPGQNYNNPLTEFGFGDARKDITVGAWADTTIDVTRSLQVTPGLRADLFASGNRAVPSVDPRISARYRLSKNMTVTHGLAIAHQAPSFVVPVAGLKPSLAGGLQTALQHSAGVSYQLPADTTASVTLFQNAFFNMTDYISLARLSKTTSQGSADIRSLGHAYGAELMLRRSLSRDFGGFVSYTLSRSLRSGGQLQGPAMTDRTHVLNVAASYNLGRNWRLGGRWLFYSGIPVEVAYLEAAKTPPRTPPFWRIDFKLQKRWIIAQPNVWWGLVFEVLNTTLNKETLSGGCNAHRCTYESFGPVTVPSIGAEGAF